MTTTNAAADKTSVNTGAENAAPEKGAEKIHEKLAEKRRALGRGLASLLPGPRVVPVTPTLPQSARKDGAPDSSSFSSSSAESAEFGGGRAGTPVAPLNAAAESPAEPFDELQAVVSGRSPDGETVFLLEIALIDDNPYQTRTDFNDDAIRELRDSIAVQGVLQPIAVRPGTEGRFILILGERRLHASKKAGKDTIPALIRRVSDQQAAEMTIIENLQREDLSPLEQAQAFKVLSQEFQLTQQEIGERVGLSRQSIANYMRLLKLPREVMEMLAEKRLSFEKAKTLLSLSTDDQISHAALFAVKNGMNIEQIETLVLSMNSDASPFPGIAGAAAPKKSSGARWVDPNVRAAQTDLERLLGVRVRIRDRKGKGKIVIEYATVDDYERVLEMMRGRK